ncbi:alpha/beta hydrolase [Peribacillus sp. SI8-4]|uniref:alpha/beta hydrolase n=1 Tax=Peribacillus sp. SI8-4 TaxID=3048009 RepID=UPI00255580B5|nr:alpha/beta hydrolase [Peribacillus sp. SI8-4]
MKKWWLVIAGLLSYIIGVGLYFSNRIMYMKKKEDAFIQNREILAKRLVREDFDNLPKTEFWVSSPSGYPLKCLFVEPHQTNKWMVISHGVTENKVNSIKYMNIFLKRGYNAIIYDHRRHGDSGGKTSSYGHYEKLDLKAVIDELKRLKGPDLTIGIHGESMGAATLLLYAGMLEDGADFYISDCPFSNFEDQIQHQLKSEIPLPSWTVFPLGRLFIKLRDGYWTNEVSPIKYMKNIHSPVLFIHSEKDTFIPVSMTMDLYAAKEGPKQLYIAKKGAHAQSYNENPQEYEAQIDQFLKLVE